MKIGIYGGTFDPPHTGHARAAAFASRELALDRLYVIPTATPPHKQLSPGSASGEDRFEMTALSMKNVPAAEVSRIELDRGGRSYTADTLSYIRSLHPGDDVYLLMGTDMFLSLENWFNSEYILKNCIPAAFSRGEGDRERLEEHSLTLSGTFGTNAVILDNPVEEMSSTEIRQLLASGSGSAYVGAEVYGYILRKRLYSVKPDPAYLRSYADGMLKPTRIPHVRGCEQEAVRLALRWGGDTETVREAAILHDITKKLSLDEQLRLCERYGIMIDDAQAASADLLHSVTAAAIAGSELGCSDEVCSAIRYHTTGKEAMTLSEKIVYLADFIEPNRSFEGLEEVRAAAYENLDEAVLAAMEMSLKNLESRSIRPHESTVKAAVWLKEHKGRTQI